MRLKAKYLVSLSLLLLLLLLLKQILDHSKYITTPEFNMSTAEIFAARLAKANLASKNDIANFVRKTDLDDKLKNLNKNVNPNKTKHVLAGNESNEL